MLTRWLLSSFHDDSHVRAEWWRLARWSKDAYLTPSQHHGTEQYRISKSFPADNIKTFIFLETELACNCEGAASRGLGCTLRILLETIHHFTLALRSLDLMDDSVGKLLREIYKVLWRWLCSIWRSIRRRALNYLQSTLCEGSLFLVPVSPPVRFEEAKIAFFLNGQFLTSFGRLDLTGTKKRLP